MTDATFNGRDPVAALRQWRERWLPESLDMRPWAKRCGYQPIGVRRERRVFRAPREDLDAAAEAMPWARAEQPWGTLALNPGDTTPYLLSVPLVEGEDLHLEQRFGKVRAVMVGAKHYRRTAWFLDTGATCDGHPVRFPLVKGVRARRSMRPAQRAALARVDETIETVYADEITGGLDAGGVDPLGLTAEDHSDLTALASWMLPLELLAAALERTPSEMRTILSALDLESVDLLGSYSDLTPSRLGEKLGFSDAWEGLPVRVIADAIKCSRSDAHRHRARLRTPWKAYAWICDVEARRQAKVAVWCPICEHFVDRLVGKKACRPCDAKQIRARRSRAA